MVETITIPYAPRPGQRALHELAETVRFLVCVCHRQWGKTTFGVNECLSAALFTKLPRPQAAYVAPFRVQAKSVAWESLKHFCRAIPGVIFNETELRADFPEVFGGGRIMLAGSDNPDAMRGMYFDLVVLDEYALMAPRTWGEILRPTLASRNGRALFIGTPLGRNHFHETYERAGVLPQWGRVLYKASESGVLSAAELASSAETMSPEQYAQEMECSWTSIADGSIFGKLLDDAARDGRIGDVPWNPGLPVDTAWDLGIGDSTAIWFIQRQRSGATRIIDFYEASGVGLSHYAKLLKEKPYNYGQHIAPHDIEVSEFGSGKTRRELALELGIRFESAPKLSVDEGIDAVRRLLPQVWIDRTRCKRGLEALQAYRRVWDERLRMFTQKPLHDWASHSCDALRTYATGFKERRPSGENPSAQETAFSIFT